MAKQLTLHNTKLKIHNAPPWICSCSFSRCIKVMIPLVSTCVMGLVHRFSLFFPLGWRGRNWSELSYISFPGVTQEMLVVQLLVLRLSESAPEKQWTGNFTAAKFLVETSSLQSARKWCCRSMVQLKEMRAGNSQASNFETQAGLEVLARKKKKSLNLSALGMWSLSHPYSPGIQCCGWNMFLGILSPFCLYTGGSSSFESK